MARGVNAIMRRQVEKHEGDGARMAVWLQALASVATAEDLPFLFKRGGRDAGVLKALAARGIGGVAPEKAVAWVRPLLGDTDTPVRLAGLRLAGSWEIDALREQVQSVIEDESAELAERRVAVSALGQMANGATALKTILDNAKAGSLHVAALRALISADANEAERIILARVDASESPEAVAPILQNLLDQKGGAAALTRALQEPNALSPAGARMALKILNTTGRTESKTSELLMKLAGINAALPAYTKAYVSNVVKAAKTFGDAEEGRKIYEQTGCIACHIPGAAQSKIGPDLSAISRGMPIDMIITEVVWPALNVKEGYEAATVTMKDGSVVAGFKETDTAGTIGVRDMATGEVRTIAKADTTAIQTGGTVMPDGLTAGMDERQLAHLIRYLSELGQ